MGLATGEFIRRFLLHVLPDGFHRIRHYGLFANGHRARKVELCRALLEIQRVPTDRDGADSGDAGSTSNGPPPCPCCGGRMTIIETFEGSLSRPYHVRRLDGL
jgi:hypothetical protein